MMLELSISTTKQVELVDITESVIDIIGKSGIVEGVCVVYIPHATAAVIINEYEPHLEQDMLGMLKSIIDGRKGYKHDMIDSNAAAHLRSALVGPSVSVPISSRKLMLGTWQRILLCEFDGPRKRRVYVSVLGQKQP